VHRLRSSNGGGMRLMCALGLVATLIGCQAGPNNPLAPSRSDAGDASTGAPADIRLGSAAALVPEVCRGGPGGFPCWTPGSRPPTGPQRGLITFDFAGTISYLPPPFDQGAFALGQAVSGSYTFLAEAADQDPSPGVGFYENVTGFTFSIPAANYSGSASPGSRLGFIEILDDEDGARDRYVASMTAPDQNVSGPVVPWGTLNRLAIVLRDRTTLAFSSDALPLVPPSLTDFASGHEFFVGFTGAFGTGEFGVTLTSLTLR
jgi:hypothetical protein